MIKPCGCCVLIEVEPVENTYEGTSLLRPTHETKREFGGRDIGKIISIGPLAFKSLDGCTSAEDWGVKIGDMVEFNRYDGKVPRLSEKDEKYKNYRLIHDNDILAVYEE